jgi:hypothetical protein
LRSDRTDGRTCHRTDGRTGHRTDGRTGHRTDGREHVTEQMTEQEGLEVGPGRRRFMIEHV